MEKVFDRTQQFPRRSSRGDLHGQVAYFEPPKTCRMPLAETPLYHRTPAIILRNGGK